MVGTLSGESEVFFQTCVPKLPWSIGMGDVVMRVSKGYVEDTCHIIARKML